MLGYPLADLIQIGRGQRGFKAVASAGFNIPRGENFTAIVKVYQQAHQFRGRQRIEAKRHEKRGRAIGKMRNGYRDGLIGKRPVLRQVGVEYRCEPDPV